MKKQIQFARASKLIVSMFLMVLALSGIGQAATVRGRVDHVSPGGQRTSMAGVAVTVLRPGMSRSAPVYTDANGMYYLQNVPAGTYDLEVWTSRDPRVPPTKFRIQVGEPYTDVPPVVA
jgi:hypothetical protein